MRAVLDPNVLTSALISPARVPSALVRAWLDGVFDIVVSPKLLAELQRALGYPHLAERVPADDAQELVELLRRAATVVADQERSAGLPASRDAGDDHLVALAVVLHSISIVIRFGRAQRETGSRA